MLIVLAGAVSTALAQDALLQFPVGASILKDNVALYSGPNDFDYATDTLNQGDAVTVHRRNPDGWCAIGPPEGSFSLVPATAVKLIDPETGIIVTEGVKSWVGTRKGEAERPMSQVMLNVNERVKVLGKIDGRLSDGQSSNWYQISPPAGEFRWVHISDLQMPTQRMGSPDLASNTDQVEPVQFDQASDPADQTPSDESVNDLLSKDGADSKLLKDTKVGYDDGFIIANEVPLDLKAGDLPFSMRINGWGQLRQTYFDSDGTNADANQFQLKRGRLIFSGSAFTHDFSYFFQLDGRSSSGDDVRVLDYLLTYDIGRHKWGLDEGTFGFKTGKYKMPFTLARWVSGKEFEFTDRSVASTYFDVNRSLGWGLYGRFDNIRTPLHWETAIFNGLVTGGAETGSSGALDKNFAYSARLMMYPTGNWGTSELSDYECHRCLATRIGAGWANSTIDRSGETEFDSIRVVDSGRTLASILPGTVDEYAVNLFSIDASMKYQGWSLTTEYYFRQVNDFRGASIPSLFDHGWWLQVGKFIVPQKYEIMARWSNVIGDSGTLGVSDQSASEVAGGFVRYFRGQNAKFTVDATYLNGAPIDSASLDISPGDVGWLYRTQIQFAF